ncbi:phosphomannomutase/phosphoglucomutase [Candidatus Uhrbacteria bacterium]|nr:phosphomannomutase/phosphoglucomutase [Candidatus Uhrbacteria bacterium]
METTIASVFKAYDIRGLAPEQLNSAFALKLGKALAAHFGPKRVLVGRDMRTTSFPLESALIEGLTSSGVEVVRIGLCSTPMFYVLTGMAQSTKPFDMGIMVTASHNPSKYNGFKIIRGDCLPVGQGSGMEELRDAFLTGKETKTDHAGTVADDPDALERYIGQILALAELPESMPQMKVAIDAGNGMAGAILPRLLSRLPWLEVLPLFFEPDGTFPNHEANPLKVETLNELILKVKNENCVLGVAFDGDADRIGFVDEEGVPIPGDLMTAFLAKEILKDNKGAKVLIDVRASWAAQEAIEEAGGVFEFCRVGHALIKKQMRESGAIFAGELSMHMYFHDLWNVESGDLALLLLLRRLASTGRSVSELMAPLKRYANSGEMNFEISDKAAVLSKLKEKYSPEASFISEIDGLRIEHRDQNDKRNDWWFSVRASNTEPLLRLVVEARDVAVLNDRVAELRGLIQAV